jgi:hypothetical protein
MASGDQVRTGEVAMRRNGTGLLFSVGVAFSLSTSIVLPAPAGVNAGGVLVVHDQNLLYTIDGWSSVCGQGVPLSCSDVDTRIDGADNLASSRVWKVYAAFPPTASPRLKGISWGITVSPSVVIVARGLCGYLEITDEGWPGNNLGCGMIWETAQTTRIVPVYAFAGYSYSTPATFGLRGHPAQGGYFQDDTAPPVSDLITAYGSLGFGAAGFNPCASGAGACCTSAGDCSMALQPNCPDEWHGEWTTCAPNPCPQPEGACCHYMDGSCTLETQANCMSPNIWLGEGTTCYPSNPCPQPVGACCVTSTCFIVSLPNCYAQGGMFQGPAAPCVPSPCTSSAAGDLSHGIQSVSLSPVTPNPSRGPLQYTIALPAPADVQVSVLDIKGRNVRELLLRRLPTGIHTFTWNPEGQSEWTPPSGVYALRLRAKLLAAGVSAGASGEPIVDRYIIKTQKMVLLR